jgi:fermentation-respiration switch protein FrsA (DUF1100 family)
MAGWLLAGAIAYLGVVAGMYVLQRSFLYFPSAVTPEPAEYGAEDMRVVRYAAADGTELAAWFRPPEDGRTTIVYFHGNAGHLGDRADKTRAYRQAGHGLLLAGYRGYGGNAGRPTESGLYADARAAFGWLAGQGIDPPATVVYGESLGSGVAVQMAVEHPVAGVVLEAPFSSVVDVGQARFPILPVRWLMLDRYDSAAKIARAEAPVLILHGERDLTVPIRYGRRLYRAAEEPRAFAHFPLAGHNDLYDHGAAERVLAFLAELRPVGAEAAS